MITLHTRLRHPSPEQDAALSGYAERFHLVAHHLASDMAREGRAGASFKNAYLRRFDITARQFNAVRQYVEGLADNRVENLKHLENTLSDKIAATQKLLPKLERQIKKAEKDGDTAERIQRLENRLHQKKRKLGNLLERQSQALAELHRPYASGLCFGGRKLFNAQHHVQENGYTRHDAWLVAWRNARSNQFFVLGSRDETAGCQGCVARIREDGAFLLDVRLPGTTGERVTLGPLRFPYGGEKLRAALERHAGLAKGALPRVTMKSRNGKAYTRVRYPEDLPALSWRFLRDGEGWRVFVSFEAPRVSTPLDTRAGVLAVDINADCLAWAELDRFGNPVATGNLSCVTYGRTAEQARAVIESAALALVQRAAAARKPLILEKLDFSRKKGQLTEVDGPRYARMLSSLSYRKIHDALSVRARKDGVALLGVNPAYTSVLGRLHWAERHGITVHEGAAVAIGRRGMRLRETPAHRLAKGEKFFRAPDGQGTHVTFAAPVRMRARHVWSYLNRISRKLTAELAAQRMARKLDPPGYAASSTWKRPNAPVVAAA